MNIYPFLNESINVRSSFWLIVILVKNSIIRNKLMKFLRVNNIETRVTFFPIHEMPIYKIKKKVEKKLMFWKQWYLFAKLS